MGEIKERIIEMLKSDDIEMVRLGATLMEKKIPRKEWSPILRECQKVEYTTQIDTNSIFGNTVQTNCTTTYTPNTSTVSIPLNTYYNVAPSQTAYSFSTKWKFIIAYNKITITTDTWFQDSVDLDERQITSNQHTLRLKPNKNETKKRSTGSNERRGNGARIKH